MTTDVEPITVSLGRGSYAGCPHCGHSATFDKDHTVCPCCGQKVTLP